MPTLLILAAGMGSRYGGLKQLDPIGPSGETILDYSVYDAIRAGFNHIVFLIRRDIENDFREKILTRYDNKVATSLAFQQPDDLPTPYILPHSRTKPWGTGHAVWCARQNITTPFAAINADDFYGADAFQKMATYLADVPDSHAFSMVAYRLDKTLSDFGSVSRGVCDITADGFLRSVDELTNLSRQPDGTIAGNSRILADDTPVSMNFWGFTPHIFPLLEAALTKFLSSHITSEKAECYLPSAVAEMIAMHQASVRVLPTSSDWFGVTYQEDRPYVAECLHRLTEAGDYVGITEE